jgi:hypothetical protein
MYCEMDTLRIVGCGGLLRHSDGKWLTEYSRKIVICDALSVEMWEICLGIHLVWRKGFGHLQGKSDSKTVVDMIIENLRVIMVNRLL